MTASDPEQQFAPQRNLPTMLEIDVTPITYFSPKDEDHFFRWAQELSCVTAVDSGFLSVDTELVSEPELRELLALITRYGLSVEPLRKLANASNQEWFNDPQAYWNAG